jgi:WD40 repeat protein
MQPSRAGTLLRVLICCVAEDETAARELARRLRVERCEVQLSLDGPVGASLARADVALLCFTPRSTDHGQLAHSLSTAFELARRSANERRIVLGVKLAECVLPQQVAHLPLFELYAPRGYERLMRALWSHIAALRNHPRPAATAASATQPSGGTTAPAPAPTQRQQGLPGTVGAPPLRFRASHPEFAQRQARRLSRGTPGAVWAISNSEALVVAAGGAVQIDLPSAGVVWEIDSPIRCAALSPDGRKLALVSSKLVMLWDLLAGKLFASYASPQPVRSLAFHPQGSMLIAGGQGGMLVLWRLEGRSSAPVQPMTLVNAHQEPINALAYAPDGALIATGSADRTVRLWRTLDRSLVRSLSEAGAVEALAFSPNGATLAAGHRGRAVSLWEVASGQRRSTLADHDGPIEALAFAPNGTTLASGCTDGSVSLWQASDGALLRDLQGPGGPVTGLAFTPNNKTLLVSAEQGLLSLDASSGEQQSQSQPFSLPVSALALSTDTIALGQRDGRVRIRSLADGAVAEASEPQAGSVVGVGFLPDNTVVMATSRGLIQPVGTQHAASSGSAESAGVPLRHASICGVDLALSAAETGVLLWRAEGAGWRRWATVPTRPQRARQAVLAPTGTMLAAIFEEGGVQTWHLPRSRQGTPDLFRAWPEAGRGTDLTFTHDGNGLVVACEDGTVRIWQLANGAQSAAFSSEGALAQSVALTPDGQVLAAGFNDGSVRLWRLNGQAGKRKAVRSAPIALFGHASAVERLAFSPDGAALVTVGSDGTVRVWPL